MEKIIYRHFHFCIIYNSQNDQLHKCMKLTSIVQQITVIHEMDGMFCVIKECVLAVALWMLPDQGPFLLDHPQILSQYQTFGKFILFIIV